MLRLYYDYKSIHKSPLDTTIDVVWLYNLRWTHALDYPLVTTMWQLLENIDIDMTQ